MAVTSEKAVKSYLTEFGLNDKEVAIYLTLLKTGPSTIMDLSRKTNIKRSTTHNNVEELIKKGLVSQTNYGERRMAVAEDPEKLKFLLEQRKWDVNKLEKIMPDIVKSIYENIPGAKENSKVDVKYYQGKKDVQLIYELTLKEDEVYSFINLDNYYEVFPGTVEMFDKAFDRNSKRKVWDIAVDTELARELSKSHDRYFCKFLPKDNLFSGVDILIFGNQVAIIQLQKEHTVATLIDSKIIADSLRVLHKTMWGLIK